MVKIGYVINNLPVGGAEILLLNLVKRMVENEYQIFVYTLYSENPLKSDFERTGARVRLLKLRNRRQFHKIPKLMSMIAKDKVDIIHTHLCDADLYGRIAARLAGVRTIMSTEHSIDPWKTSMIFKYRVQSLLDLYTTRFCKVIICVSKAVRDFHVRWGIPLSKTTVIYPSKPQRHATVSRNIMRQQLNISQNDFVVTSIGRLYPVKNQVELIKAAGTILREYNDIKFVIVGDGPLLDELRGRINSMRFNRKILLLGRRDDIADILNMSDVFILPSLYEGFPLTIIEAMQHELPVIASNVGGIPEMFDETTGILVNPTNSGEIVAAIQTLYNNTELRIFMKKAALKRVNTMFNFDDYVTKMIVMYRKIAEQQ
jgi:glycosyltransferase involved in cell wall biosynthesis